MTRVDAQMLHGVDSDAAEAAQAEVDGYHSLWIGETAHDPFLRLLLATGSTTTLGLGTSIAVAFSRSPMTVAATSYDLARLTRGRFVLGLGSQVKGHIERRFSMPWSHPAARMREYVLALKAIWSTWTDGTPLDFRGEFYTHTLMTPFFSPEPHEWGPPPVYLAGVGELMTEVVGEVAEGWFWHPFTTQAFLREVSLPSIERGRAKAGRTMDDFAVTGPAFIATGRTPAELETAIAGTKKQIAFYASTPAYRPVLDHHGWGELTGQLNAMAKQGQWDEMTGLISDELLDAMAIVAPPEQAAQLLVDRWGDVATSLTFYAPYESDPTIWPELASALKDL